MRTTVALRFKISIQSVPALLGETRKAFSLNAIVDVRLRRRHEMNFLISWKLLELAT